jgi:hypothetical protein
VQAAFHPRRVAGYADTMVARAAATADRWRPGEPVDLHADTVRTTLTVAGATLLGTDVESGVDAVEDAIADLLAAYRLAFAPFGWRLHRLPVGPARRLRRGRVVLDELVDRLIAARRAEPGDDLLSALATGEAAAEAGAEPLSDAELRDEAVTLLLAGHETTAGALAFAFHLLASHAGVERRLHDELDAVLGGRRPGADDLERLPVTRGVLAEALRLYPPSWAMGRQAATAHRPGRTPSRPAISCCCRSGWCTATGGGGPSRTAASRTGGPPTPHPTARGRRSSPSAAGCASASASGSPGPRGRWRWPRSLSAGASSRCPTARCGSTRSSRCVPATGCGCARCRGARTRARAARSSAPPDRIVRGVGRART